MGSLSCSRRLPACPALSCVNALIAPTLFRVNIRLRSFHSGTSITTVRVLKAYVQVMICLLDMRRISLIVSSIDKFSKSQTYAVILLPNGGPDLEAFPFTTCSRNVGWQQACSVFWQVTRSLTSAEEILQFEV